MTIQEKDQAYIWHPYTQMHTAKPAVPIVKAKDAILFTEDGKEIIDAVSSWWVNPLGHARKEIADAITAQMHELEHVIFAGFTHKPAVDLAETLLNLLPSNQKRVFYTDNGSTAIESAMKMAIQYYYNQGQSKSKLIALDGAYHGDTFGAMSAGAKDTFFSAYDKFSFDVEHLPFPNGTNDKAILFQLENALKQQDIAAFIFEPLLQGSAGMRMYSPEILDKCIALCKQYKVLTIADEVMTGFGRTGKLFACDYLTEQPDMMCFSKCLTAGFMPLAVTTCSAEIYEAFLSEDKMKTFFHGHSYTGNAMGCAAALASLKLLTNETTKNQIAQIASSHTAQLAKWKEHKAVRTIRQLGTVLALEFETGENTSYFSSLRDELYDFFLERGVLLRPLGNVVYILPPYVITDEELKKVYRVIEEALDRFGKN
jgi:adenosylmethionine-8-amino-7-oxononanoate aminotransferase